MISKKKTPTSHKLRIEGNFFNLIQNTYKTLQPTYLMVKALNFLIKIRYKIRLLPLITVFNFVIGVLANIINQKRKLKVYILRRKK